MYSAVEAGRFGSRWEPALAARSSACVTLTMAVTIVIVVLLIWLFKCLNILKEYDEPLCYGSPSPAQRAITPPRRSRTRVGRHDASVHFI